MKWLLVLAACAGCAKPKYDCTRTRQVLAKTDVYTLRKLPAHTVWSIYPRSIENEAKLRRYLDAKLGTNPGGEALYAVECHAVVCKVEINRRLEDSNWGPPLHGLREHRADWERTMRDYDHHTNYGYAWLVETGADVEQLRKPTRCRDKTADYVRGKIEQKEDDDDEDD